MTTRANCWAAAVAASVVVAPGCATAPPTVPPTLTVLQKLAVIIQLEHQRAVAPPDGAVVAVPALVPGTPRPAMPGLIELLHDPEARVRRRAAIALGRVGLPEAVAPLSASLADSNPAVRQMAAFALGQLAASESAEALVMALGDPDLLGRGRAAEALGRIGAREAAPAVGAMVAQLTPMAAAVEPDDMTYPQPPAVEAFRLGVIALARLEAYAPLAAAVLDENNLPRVRWWPVAWALQRLGDPRGAAALAELTRGTGSYRIAFAAEGLGRVGEAATAELLAPLLDPARYDAQVVVAAVRALAGVAGPNAVAPLIELLRDPDLDPGVLLEVVRALGRIGGEPSTDLFLDLISFPQPAIRAEALRGLADDAQVFLIVLSGFDTDPHWSVRATLAELLGAMNPDLAVPRLETMLDDPDRRVLPAVLASLARHRAPGAADAALDALEDDDPVIRMAGARQLGILRPPGGAAALVQAYETSQGGQGAAVRRAIVDAVVGFGGAEATEVLGEALMDADWAVRLRAASLLDAEEAGAPYASRIRPMPGPTFEESLTLADPAVSPQVYLDTDAGTIQIELTVLDAPLSTRRFAELAGNGYFHDVPFHEVVPNGVVRGGDPRGDGFGGSGLTVRDEVSERPILRGTVAMDWQNDEPETGAGQFLIALTPQPDLDGRYTVIGRVVDGMAIVDGLTQWDVIRRSRVWDGVSMVGRE
ncbi:MAG: HEAT repeat domain-containing protein [Vicinamibacterales bacterium]|jgi:HEAT repeat protein/cyclophilin family peptidyl-prolyl cis-trans isomerase|nr:HEAT repeat domain-containing protein [Vicinamibacterales bacterium]MDP6608908.1 HEAT repeat domain-containing protein [Vicinamibacterales bacterium]HAK54259.1 hypothetical protein [Acidobacteriota bacterium]